MENKHFEMEKTCEYCGNTFIARKENTRFCSQRCQKRAMAIRKQTEMEDQDYEETDIESERQGHANMDDNQDYFGVLGGLFGVRNQGSKQEKMLTSLLAVQKSQIESNQSIALLKMQMDTMSKELESLRSENNRLRDSEATLKSENDRLCRENEELSSENEKLTDLAEECNNKTAQLGSLAGTVLTQALVGLLPHTKVGRLMGFGSDDEVTSPQVSGDVSAPCVSVSPVVQKEEIFECEAV